MGLYHFYSSRLCGRTSKVTRAPTTTSHSCILLKPVFPFILLFNLCESQTLILHWTNTEIQHVNLDNPGAELNHNWLGTSAGKTLSTTNFTHTHIQTYACSLKKSLNDKKSIFKPLIKQTNPVTNPFLPISSWDFKSTILKDNHSRKYI